MKNKTTTSHPNTLKTCTTRVGSLAVLLFMAASPAKAEEAPADKLAILQSMTELDGLWKISTVKSNGIQNLENSFKGSHHILISGSRISLSGKKKDLKAYLMDFTTRLMDSGVD